MLELLKKASKSEGLKQTSVTVVGNVMATGLSAVALILISRLLGPAKFGEFSVGFSIILILNRLNDLGLNATITKFVPKFEDNYHEINQFFGYTLKIKFIFSAILIGVGVVTTPFLAELLHFENPAIIYWAFILGISTTWYEQLLSLLQALHKFSQSVVANAVQAGIKLLGALIFFSLGFNLSLPVFIFYMMAPLVPVALSKFLLPKWFKPDLKYISPESRRNIWEMARFSAVGFITAGLVENVDILFVQHYLNPFETGLLAGVSRIAAMISLIAFSLSSVLNARVSRYQTQEHLRPYIRKSFILTILVGLGFIAFLPFSRLLIWLTIGPEYVSGVNILYILAASAFITIASIPFLALFYTLKADWYFSFAGILQAIIIIAGNLLFVEQYGIEASALTRLTVRVLLFISTVALSLWLYHRKYNLKTNITTEVLNETSSNL